jgi:hypothetical protein
LWHIEDSFLCSPQVLYASEDEAIMDSLQPPKMFNVYCDESCHLENDGHGIMVVGALWCSSLRASGHARALRALKSKHNLSPSFEIKWTKVSESKVDFYLEVLETFFARNAGGGQKQTRS